MEQSNEFLMNIRKIIRLHEQMLKNICEEYGLSLTEAAIISFLHNNPGRDTAADIVEFRMLQKGNVSRAVELLAKKELLVRKADLTDRRKIHLCLSSKAEPILDAMEPLRQQFISQMFEGFSPEEQRQFIHLNRRMGQNIQNAIERKNQYEQR